MALSHPKPPKEKRTVQKAIQDLVDQAQPFNANTIARAVGISRHRVLKYCKSHRIDLDELNRQIGQGNPSPALQTAPAAPQPTKHKRKSLIQLDEPKNNKIKLEAPQRVKIQLRDPNTD
ncbi:hypothetical protein KTD15_06330 [Burkholderia multivorans]|uniref:hypothetical protein n=1 Tax=Burkholderia multivorans TaxID=87883 RepID=UPI001C210064|nr:hypothetical protein [Burkholderia multivorans]MBU9118411.1 hypothetical protein [Burkholderia multivorans]